MPCCHRNHCWWQYCRARWHVYRPEASQAINSVMQHSHLRLLLFDCDTGNIINRNRRKKSQVWIALNTRWIQCSCLRFDSREPDGNVDADVTVLRANQPITRSIYTSSNIPKGLFTLSDCEWKCDVENCQISNGLVNLFFAISPALTLKMLKFRIRRVWTNSCITFRWDLELFHEIWGEKNYCQHDEWRFLIFYH